MEEEKKSTASKFKTICVFCGSNVLKNIDLVYGGESIGLMGLISKTVFNGGRNIIGVIPKALMGREITGVTVREVKPVIDMYHRKTEMGSYTDAFIALPRGYGTLEELFEVISWAQLDIHNKPRYITYALFHIGLVNVDGYYNSLLSFIDKVLEKGFINLAAWQIIISSSNAKELIENIKVIIINF
ncbi:Cytokinin riboside 5'-monophosphate phosphoribohydrolase LOG protein [Dioscorea alata]|uniref:Cytokinin riboside 5'-monophosphate phosphoribohydrolase LOG protein n=1 Tax=Dioscorea alata TaxID=55571 RepID=A0ACB7TPH3_DIOAL|nr:Cytokinin riboside 5'-monophosphate phosphoribohydrolase LOG protein [Dioscorea alata]